MPHITRIVLLVLAALLAACSGQGGSPTAVPTVFIPIIGTDQPPTPGGTSPVAATEAAPAEWAALGLTGRLRYTLGKDGIQELDLLTGETRPVFVPPENTWLTSAATAPDDSQLALAYAPPPPEGVAQLGYTSIYALPGDCAERGGCTVDDLSPLVLPEDAHEAFFSPTWSPNGQELIVAHFIPSQAETNSPFRYVLERQPLPQGERSLLIDNAIWPSVSTDGARLAYVWFDPEDYSNDLYVANADGTDQRELVDPALFEAVDAPFFSADSQYVYFSAVGEGNGQSAAPAAWLDNLLGVRAAEAAPDRHNVPSDWWRVPAAGGTPERLTHIFDTGLFGDISPDGAWIGFASASGLYVMRPDGSQLTRLSRTAGAGTLEWLP